MVLNPRKCKFTGFGKPYEYEVFTYHEICLKKTTTKKLLGITIDEHLNTSEPIKRMYVRAPKESLIIETYY